MPDSVVTWHDVSPTGRKFPWKKSQMISWHIPLKSSRTCWCSSESRCFFWGGTKFVLVPPHIQNITYKPIPNLDLWEHYLRCLHVLTISNLTIWALPRLKKIMRKRSRLRLVVASATLDAGAFLSGWPSWLFQTGNALCRLERLEINRLRRRCWHVNPSLFFIFFIRKVTIRWFQILV